MEEVGPRTSCSSTFELAPGSEPTEGDDIGYTVICENAAGTDTVFAQGSLIGATVHTGDGESGDVGNGGVPVHQYHSL